MTHPHRLAASLACAAVWLATTAASATEAPAAPARPVVDAPNHRLCTHGPSHDGKPTCMSRADAAVERSRQAALDKDPAQYLRNAMMRCSRLPEADRRDCESRMRGQGTTTGSVEGGGVYRELITRDPMPLGGAAPASTGLVPSGTAAPRPGPASR
ncbi:hypothetical protein [Ideonella sp. A 288]|uniref:hypothetical protein n=1 Tax=Ideonella sp. A 288 TaxID=1962181 RepID=UPI000B4A9D90|nr:hypothetical protein [Ideonella sp. A 288]